MSMVVALAVAGNARVKNVRLVMQALVEPRESNRLRARVRFARPDGTNVKRQMKPVGLSVLVGSASIVAMCGLWMLDSTRLRWLQSSIIQVQPVEDLVVVVARRGRGFVGKLHRVGALEEQRW